MQDAAILVVAVFFYAGSYLSLRYAFRKLYEVGR